MYAAATRYVFDENLLTPPTMLPVDYVYLEGCLLIVNFFFHGHKME